MEKNNLSKEDRFSMVKEYSLNKNDPYLSNKDSPKKKLNPVEDLSPKAKKKLLYKRYPLLILIFILFSSKSFQINQISCCSQNNFNKYFHQSIEENNIQNPKSGSLIFRFSKSVRVLIKEHGKLIKEIDLNLLGNNEKNRIELPNGTFNLELRGKNSRDLEIDKKEITISSSEEIVILITHKKPKNIVPFFPGTHK